MAALPHNRPVSSSVRTAPLDTGCTGDVARAETGGERIRLRADELNGGSAGFRAVTLYLTRGEARSLAGVLARIVIEIESA